MGNPLNDGTWTYTWKHGRQLVSMTDGTTTVAYTYNADGMRIGKTVTRSNYSETHKYFYDNGNLTYDVITIVDNGVTTTHDLLMSYDESGRPMMITYDHVSYYYLLNAQGDVVAITSVTGVLQVAYTYDAWGNVLSITGPMADTMGYWNQLRYRGYVYDQETGLYYLQSRYYNPEIGRFINADGLVATGQGLLGNNMFVYCLNDPVNFVDSDGASAEALQWWTAGLAWLPFSDTVLPFGDFIYAGGILVLGTLAYASAQEDVPKISYDEGKKVAGSPSPNNNNGDDEDDDDEYYADDNNFGSRQKVGKSKGKTPGNNQAQNKQFKDATKGLTPDQKRIVHNKISGKGKGFHDIKAIVEGLFTFVVGFLAFELK